MEAALRAVQHHDVDELSAEWDTPFPRDASPSAGSQASGSACLWVGVDPIHFVDLRSFVQELDPDVRARVLAKVGHDSGSALLSNEPYPVSVRCVSGCDRLASPAPWCSAVAPASTAPLALGSPLHAGEARRGAELMGQLGLTAVEGVTLTARSVLHLWLNQPQGARQCR